MVPRLVAEGRSDSGGVSTSYVSVETNVLALMPRPQFGSALKGWLEEAKAFAREISGRYEQLRPTLPPVFLGGLELFGMDPGPPKDADEAEWVLRAVVLRAAYWYLRQAPSLTAPDETLARQISEEVVIGLPTKGLVARQAMVMDGIELEWDQLVCGNSRIRALSSLERGELVEMPTVSPSGGRFRRIPDMTIPSHALEVDNPIDHFNKMGMLPAPALIPALQLHQVEWAGPGVMTTYIIPEWFWGGHYSRPIPTRAFVSGRSRLTQKLFEEACETAERLARYRLDMPERRAELALQRFTAGCGRSDLADSLIDFGIALEALLLPYDGDSGNSNLSYRFRLHGAYFIPDSPAERRQVFRTLRKLYDMRSSLVHGSGRPDPSEAQASAVEARRLAARGLLKAVRNGFPDAIEFNRLVLGEAPAPADPNHGVAGEDQARR